MQYGSAAQLFHSFYDSLAAHINEVPTGKYIGESNDLDIRLTALVLGGSSKVSNVRKAMHHLEINSLAGKGRLITRSSNA